MCNEAYRRSQIDKIRTGWENLRVPLLFPEGVPNFAALDSIRITDRVDVVRAARAQPGAAEMVTRRWSWPGPSGKPVYNYRSDGREFANAETSGRCLIPVDGFFEFTAPPPAEPGVAKPAKKPLKSKWAFSARGHEWLCIAGLWRTDGAVGEAWTMLTCPPGPDVAPYHHRQVVVLAPSDYARWLDGSAPAAELCRPAPAGMLEAVQVR